MDEKLFAALAREVELRVSEFNVQDIANTAWAFATLDHWDDKLFAALAREAEMQVSKFNAQNIAKTAWAFATLGQLDEKLFAAFAKSAERRIRKFDAPTWPGRSRPSASWTRCYLPHCRAQRSCT